ncbi:MAG: sodium:proton exchanger, partial [Acidimicrobiia bacterium]|nr:sodium:proton exchanger [Acidimicrobiia bacterium]
VLLSPFEDAAEQAVDAITTARDRLSDVATTVPGFREVRIASGSRWAGEQLGEMSLREEFSVTVLAVSRAGRSFFNPGPAFALFPGDRLFLAGSPDALDRAAEYLSLRDHRVSPDEEDFAVAQLAMRDVSGWEGRTLAELELPKRYGVRVLAVARGDGPFEVPDPHVERVLDERLLVAGARTSIDALCVGADGAPDGPAENG